MIKLNNMKKITKKKRKKLNYLNYSIQNLYDILFICWNYMIYWEYKFRKQWSKQ
jgi:hypothetical protein